MAFFTCPSNRKLSVITTVSATYAQKYVLLRRVAKTFDLFEFLGSYAGGYDLLLPEEPVDFDYKLIAYNLPTGSKNWRYSDEKIVGNNRRTFWEFNYEDWYRDGSPDRYDDLYVYVRFLFSGLTDFLYDEDGEVLRRATEEEIADWISERENE